MIFLLSPDQQFPGSGVGTASSISYSTVFRTVKQFFVTQWAHPRVQAIVKNMNDYVFENIDKSTHADNTQAASMEDFTDSLQRVMASLDDDDSDSDDDTADSAAPPANIGTSTVYDDAPAAPLSLLATAPPAPIIASVPLPAPDVAIAPVVTISATHILTPIPESSQSIPAAIWNNNGDHSGPISPAPQTAPATAPTPVAVSAPRSHPATIPTDVAADMVQKKGRRKGKAVTAGADVAPRRSSRNGV